jgi:hypothetical protein
MEEENLEGYGNDDDDNPYIKVPTAQMPQHFLGHSYVLHISLLCFKRGKFAKLIFL